MNVDRAGTTFFFGTHDVFAARHVRIPFHSFNIDRSPGPLAQRRLDYR